MAHKTLPPLHKECSSKKKCRLPGHPGAARLRALTPPACKTVGSCRSKRSRENSEEKQKRTHDSRKSKKVSSAARSSSTATKGAVEDVDTMDVTALRKELRLLRDAQRKLLLPLAGPRHRPWKTAVSMLIFRQTQQRDTNLAQPPPE